MADPELLSIHSDIALFDARWTMLAERLFTGESGSLWRQLQEGWAALKAAMQSRDIDLINAAIKTLDRVVSSGAKDERSWRELTKLTKERASLKQAGMAQMVAMQQMMAVSDVMVLVDRMNEAIGEVIQDSRQRSALAMKFHELLNWQGVKAPAAVQVPALPAVVTSESPPTPPDVRPGEAVVVSSGVMNEQVVDIAPPPPDNDPPQQSKSQRESHEQRQPSE